MSITTFNDDTCTTGGVTTSIAVNMCDVVIGFYYNKQETSSQFSCGAAGAGVVNSVVGTEGAIDS